MLLFTTKFLIAVVLTEAITEIITKSEIFRPLRAKLFSWGQDSKIIMWLHDLIDCGYCFSVWMGVIIAIFFFADVPIFLRIIFGLVVHRFSNMFHNIMDRIHGLDG